MNILKTFITLFFLCFPLAVFSSSLQVELSSTSSSFNYFQIPNTDNNRVDLPDKTITGYRIKALIDITESTQLYLLFAPLSIDYSFQSNSAFEFDGVNFQNNTATDVTYKFNSYRIGYLWSFGSQDFKYWIGPVIKVRDAEISIAQSSLNQSFDNIGPVPLLAVGLQYKLTDLFLIHLHFDGLAAPQGSAYDGALELRLAPFEKIHFSLGARILGGGADNDKLKTFAQFNSYTASLIFNF